ncbi:MAG: hypothetical protein QG670_2456 [Thermoproteota archaeon]|nr:hypothetical protein [Thermoproteota archaeon]
MVEIVELLQYNRDIRHKFFEILTQLPWEELIKNREASFNSLRNIFIHTLNATNHWLDILQNEELYVRTQYDEYKNMDDIRRYMDKVEERYKLYSDNLTKESLRREYAVVNSAKENVNVTEEDILIHLFEEEVHHRGELMALLWQMGIEPPSVGWKKL